MGTQQFDRIYHGLSPEVGKFRVATSGMAWKGAESEGVTAMASADIKWAQWIRVARNYQLRVGLRDNRDQKKEKFDGFAREDHDRLAKILKEYFGITLETREVSVKGWNWGVTDFQGQDLAFTISDKTAFELPLRHVANSNIAGKTEVSLEFSNLSPTSTAGPKSVLTKTMGDELTEIRFYVPGVLSKLKGSDAGSQKSDDEDDGEEISAAQVFHDTIKEKAEIGQVTGDLILSFEEVLVLTPRGRYDMDMFPDFLRLRGKTYDYKVLYQSIAKLFLLPKDDMHVLFILGLSTPIRQGQTLYQYLVMQFTREEEITAELNMSEEDIAKYDKLKKNYEDPTYEVVSTVFRALAGKKIIGSGSFQSRDGHPGFKANLKAIQGDLFMLERYIFFVSKQPTLIELSDIHQVVFSRVGAGSGAAAGRTFDLKIVTKGGPEHNFTSINKEEHEVTEAYLKDKKVRVKNEMVPDADLLLAAVAGDDDDDDDMQSVVSSDSDRGKPRQKKAARDDDDSSEEDEDFKASESDAGSPSDSDSDDSGAVTASDASGDLAMTKDAKKSKSKKSKGKAKETGDDAKKPTKKKAAPKTSAAGSDAEDNKSKSKATVSKPKPKPKAKKGSDDEAMDVDVDKADKPKPRPKPKPKAKADSATGSASSKPKAKKEDDAMDVDEEKPRPKPKPKKKDPATEVEPPKKKLKKAED
ncbi:structure-specific recognition protein-domain-containing protein [Crassisporium funariophilum]|nr:structure-specific recognition protein-domain-containing protein [Crassisporium funariophilum]